MWDGKRSLVLPATPTHDPLFDFERIIGMGGMLALTTEYFPFAVSVNEDYLVCADRRGVRPEDDSPVLLFPTESVFRLSPQMFAAGRGHNLADGLAREFFTSVEEMLEHFCGSRTSELGAKSAAFDRPRVSVPPPFDWGPLLLPVVPPDRPAPDQSELSAADVLPHLTRIAEKVELIRALDPGFIAVGSEVHRHRMDPKLTDAERSAFEQSQGCILPTAYAGLLSGVGNGGAGPWRGLWCVEYSGDFWAAVRDGGRDGYEKRLRKPFPHRSAWTPDTSKFGTRQRTTYHHPKHVHGTVFLGQRPDEEGRLVTWLLVINGPERGHVWADHRNRGLGITPVVRRGPLSVLAWFENGLDGTLQQLDGAYARYHSLFRSS
jgi:hypothetical protein